MRIRGFGVIVRALSFGVSCAGFVFSVVAGIVTRPFTAKEIIWGVDPLINVKYWARAFAKKGIPSKSLVTHRYSNSSPDDFDILYDDLIPGPFKHSKFLRDRVGAYFACAYVLSHASVFHGFFTGGPLGKTMFADLEPLLFKILGIKTVITPYGSDAYIYSNVSNISTRHVLLHDYPASGRDERKIRRQVDRWNRHADVVIVGIMIDGAARWDCPAVSPISIDVDQWVPVETYSSADGGEFPVRIIHTPNHRSFKGTEYLISAISRLKAAGLKVELDLVEGVSNKEVRERIRGADILVEQIVCPGYAVSAMEGM